MVSGETGQNVAGTYRATARLTWFVWGASVPAWGVLALMNGLLQGNWWFAGMCSVLAVGNLFLVLTARRGQTVVGPDGIEIRTGLRSRKTSWDEVELVVPPTAWDPQPTLTVRLVGGTDLLTDVPRSHRDALAAYAQAHRTPGGSLPANGPVTPHD